MMDALYLYSILWAKEQGYQKFNLGMAPFSSTYKNTINLENTFIYSVYNNTQYLYSFKGLRKYKEKYKPQWAAKYLVYENKTWVLKNLYDSRNKAIRKRLRQKCLVSRNKKEFPKIDKKHKNSFYWF